MSAPLRLLACQIAIPAMTTPAERGAHLAQSATKVRRALAQTPADLVVLPELSTIDYARETFDELAALAEPLDGPSFQCWRAVAQDTGCHVSYSFPRVEGGQYFITVAVVGPDGALVGHYDKLHLAQYGASMEKDYFTRGGHLFTFEIAGLKIAPIICYDIRIPELTRALVLDHSVDLILHCGAYYRDASFATWHDFAITRALENQVFFLSLNRAGAQYGKSLFCWPWMDENSTPIRLPEHAEAFELIEIDPALRTKARAEYSFLTDRLSSYDLG